VIFPETTAIGLINALQPDAYVKEGDHSLSTRPEAPVEG
jgi:bifunctional ADP-heptose synthase (sugar kinase/adenylyltransferase)